MTLDWINALAIAISVLVIFIVRERQKNKLIDRITARMLRTNKVLSEKISELASVRVKHGQAWETFIPLMGVFEEELGDKNEAVFLGQPIDLIYFKDDEIVFAEVKTGNSKLSQRQRNVRKLVKEGKVRWAEVNDDLEFASQDTGRTN